MLQRRWLQPEDGLVALDEIAHSASHRKAGASASARAAPEPSSEAMRAAIVRKTLGDAFRARGHVRVAPAFSEAAAVRFLAALRASDHAAHQRVDPSTGFQLWRFGFEPGVGCEHPLCALGRWLEGGAAAWLSIITGVPLRPPAPGMRVADRWKKGAFADPYDPRASADDAVAVRVVLAPQAWPEAWGGHLEVTRGGRREVLAPAWNALDVIDLRGGARWAVPLVREHVEAFSLAVTFARVPERGGGDIG